MSPWIGPGWAARARLLAFLSVAVLPPLWGGLRAIRRAGEHGFLEVYLYLTSIEQREDGYLIKGVEERRYRLRETFVREMGRDSADALLKLRPGEPLFLLVEPPGRDGVSEVYALRGRERVYLESEGAIERLRKKRDKQPWLPIAVVALVLAACGPLLLLPPAPESEPVALSPHVEAQLWAGLILLSAQLWASPELGAFPAAGLGAVVLATGAATWAAHRAR